MKVLAQREGKKYVDQRNKYQNMVGKPSNLNLLGPYARRLQFPRRGEVAGAAEAEHGIADLDRTERHEPREQASLGRVDEAGELKGVAAEEGERVEVCE